MCGWEGGLGGWRRWLISLLEIAYRAERHGPRCMGRGRGGISERVMRRTREGGTPGDGLVV